MTGIAFAQDSAEELSKKLANPVAALISVPFQLNYDQDIGPLDEGERWNLNIQPLVSYTTPTALTFTLQTEATYDWEGEQWSVPVSAVATKVSSFGSQLFSAGVGLRYWADAPDGAPEGLGVRFVFTLLFPK